MRPSEISDEDIIKAGNELLDQAINVSGFSLRRALGSGNTGRLFKVWEKHLASKHEETNDKLLELPVPVQTQLTELAGRLNTNIVSVVTELYGLAIADANRSANQVKEQASHDIARAEQQIEEAANLLDDVERLNQQHKANITELTQSLQDAQAMREDQAIELAQLRERLAAMELAAKTASEHHARELAASHEDNQLVQLELEAACTNVANLHDELTQLRVTLAANEQAAVVTEQAHSQVLSASRDDTRLARAELEASMELVTSLRDDLAKLREREQATSSELLKLGQLYEKATAAAESAQQVAVMAQADSANLQGQLTALHEQNAALLATLARPDDPR